MDFWINNVYDAKAYNRAYDSLSIIVSNNKITMANDSILLFDAVELKRAKNETILAHETLSTQQKQIISKQEKKITFWKTTAFVAWALEIINRAYQTFKPSI